MEDIKKAIFKFNEESSRHPFDMEELTGNNPLKKIGETDYWGNQYRLIEIDENHLQLISDGKDGKPGTEDDIILKIQTTTNRGGR